MNGFERTIVLAVLVVGGCTEVKSVAEGGSAQEVPCEVQRIFDQSCAVESSCHVSGASGAQKISLVSGESDVLFTGQAGGLPYVDFGDTMGSYLALKLLPDPPAGDRMPLAPGEITEEERATILGWIGGAEIGCGTGGSESDSASETGATPQLCGWMDVTDTPPAMSPLVKGTSGAVIPDDIGTLLENNCGCHLIPTDAIKAPYVDYPETGAFHMETLADFQSQVGGAASAFFYEIALRKMISDSTPMPPDQCDINGNGLRIDADDKKLIVTWLAQGSPSADDWVPP